MRRVGAGYTRNVRLQRSDAGTRQWNVQCFRGLMLRFWTSFSFVGLPVATLFFAASLTPSLLPRHFVVQGILSGFSIAAGYGVGVFGVWLWHYLELPEPSERIERVSKQITSMIAAIIALIFLWRSATWQNSIRQLMEMEPIATAYPVRVALIGIVTAIVLVFIGRGVGWFWRYVHHKSSAYIPHRLAVVLSALLVVATIVMVTNKVFARLALQVADAIALAVDTVVDEGIEQPTRVNASGNHASFIDWDTIGRQGKNFIVAGPSRQSISDFWQQDAAEPIRVYVGWKSKETPEQRARLALEELKRVGGFDRSVLIIATPTGTGWLDPGAVDTLEYLHAGDTAIVAVQYSYLPSWITILVDPQRSRETARALFAEVYNHWTTLPRDARPRLYVHGLSLGSLGSEAGADLFTVFEDPIHGGVWSGPPFPSPVWSAITQQRHPDSPMWLPRIRDGSMVRFTAQENVLAQAGERWGPMRFVYIQYASDAMVFFEPSLLYRPPQWLDGGRGPDVSPHLRWYPIVTFLQTAFDLTMATTVPIGYGHNYAPANYIDAWIEVTDPPNWTDDDTERLKQLFSP